MLPRRTRVVQRALPRQQHVPRGGAGLVRLSPRPRHRLSSGTRTASPTPGWHGPGWESVNAPRARALRRRTTSCTRAISASSPRTASTARRRGRPRSSTIPLTRNASLPAGRVPDRPTLLLAGTQYQRYQVETATAWTLARLQPEWRLRVSGELSWEGDVRAARRETQALLAELGLEGRVEPRGRTRRPWHRASYQRAKHPAPHQVQRSMPHGRARGDGLRAARRLLRRAEACPSSWRPTPAWAWRPRAGLGARPPAGS